MKDSYPILLSNSYVGITANACQNDDIVVIPLESTIPIVIKPFNNGLRYVLAGEIYGHGILYGEFMEDQSTKLQIYVLV